MIGVFCADHEGQTVESLLRAALERCIAELALKSAQAASDGDEDLAVEYLKLTRAGLAVLDELKDIS